MSSKILTANNCGNLNRLIKLRRNLHSRAELSGKEEQTAETLLIFLKHQHPDLLVTSMGGHGIIAVYKGEIPGNTIMLRCDMDALPILEDTELSHRSVTSGVSHKCGHDGHMAIMAGVASRLKENRPACGTVILLFQPAEETGMGAARVIDQLEYQPDFCYALHNLPGFPMGEIITRHGSFASASKGMIVNLTGKSSHAGEPLKGITPAPAVASLISYFGRISQYSEGVFITLIHATIGEISFGTSPANATVMATLRASTTAEMNELSQNTVREVTRIADEKNLKLKISWAEEFPATENADIPNRIILQAAKQLGINCITLKKAFPWSEDFGHFTQKYQGALFGIGAGLDTPPLHSPDYDFPDQLIPIGINVFNVIIERSLEL